MSILQEQFKAADIVLAADVKPSKLQLWIHRRVIVGGDKIQGGRGPGHHRKFTFYNVMEVAIANALLEAGLNDLKVAFSAAAIFAHTSKGSRAGMARLPGLPFEAIPGVDTIFAVSGEQTCVVPNDGEGDALGEIQRRLKHPNALFVVDASQVFEWVCSSLGIDAHQALVEAYAATESPKIGFAQ